MCVRRKGSGYNAFETTQAAIKKSGLSVESFFARATQFGNGFDPAAEAKRFKEYQKNPGNHTHDVPRPVSALADWVSTKTDKEVRERLH